MEETSLERLAAGLIAEGRIRPLDDDAAAAVLGGLMAGGEWHATLIGYTSVDGQTSPDYVGDPESVPPAASDQD
jgi:hypothetical protein